MKNTNLVVLDERPYTGWTISMAPPPISKTANQNWMTFWLHEDQKASETFTTSVYDIYVHCNRQPREAKPLDLGQK